MGVINLGALVEKLRKKMSGDFISKTDYPSGDNAGVIKVDSTYATTVTTGGKLKASEITAEAYSEANDGAFISKATLDNVLAAQPAPEGLTVELVGSTSGASTTNKAITLETGKAWNDYKLIIPVLKGSAAIECCAAIPLAVLWGGDKFDFYLPSKECTAEIYRFQSESDLRIVIRENGKSLTGTLKFYGVK